MKRLISLSGLGLVKGGAVSGPENRSALRNNDKEIKCPNSAYFAKIAHKIAKAKYFPNISDDSDSPINSLSDDI